VECIKLISRLQNITIIRGNHDRAVSLKAYEDFTQHARLAVRWTIKNLDAISMNFLKNLPSGPQVIDELFAICHGSIKDEDNYILSNVQSKQEFNWLLANKLRIAFFGHTHFQINYSFDPVEKKVTVLTENKILLKKKLLYLINPGSIGQPRDKDNRGSFAVYDSDLNTIEIIRYPYNYALTRKKIELNGLPKFLGERLEKGI
jgi:predicted phosphodiesterase